MSRSKSRWKTKLLRQYAPWMSAEKVLTWWLRSFSMLVSSLILLPTENWTQNIIILPFILHATWWRQTRNSAKSSTTILSRTVSMLVLVTWPISSGWAETYISILKRSAKKIEDGQSSTCHCISRNLPLWYCITPICFESEPIKFEQSRQTRPNKRLAPAELWINTNRMNREQRKRRNIPNLTMITEILSWHLNLYLNSNWFQISIINF